MKEKNITEKYQEEKVDSAILKKSFPLSFASTVVLTTAGVISNYVFKNDMVATSLLLSAVGTSLISLGTLAANSIKEIKQYTDKKESLKTIENEKTNYEKTNSENE